MARLDPIVYRPIGLLRSPFLDVNGMPIQPTGAKGVRGHIEVRSDLVPGLQDLEGFSHVIVIYHLHEISSAALVVRPYLDQGEHGIFATRSPKRPNPIGLSVLEVVGVEGSRVLLSNVDILDGTPVLDIKPYVPRFDVWPADRVGWLESAAEDADHVRSDRRFHLDEPDDG